MNGQDKPGSGATDGGDATSPEAAVINDLEHAFELLALKPVLVGGHAMNMYCGARLTWDIDFVVDGGKADLRRCERMFTMLGYTVDGEAAKASIDDGAFIRLKHPELPLVVDIMAARSLYEEALLQRARPMDDLPFRVATPEDLLVLKLVANRQRDQRDLSELAAMPGLDWSYVERWAHAWGADKKYAELRRAGQDPLRRKSF